MEFATIVPYRRMDQWEGYREPDFLLDLVERVDRLGFYAFCAGDHLIMPNEWRRVASEHWFDPTTFLAYVAGKTRLRVLTFVVVVPYRSPYQTAKAIATLDFVSKGRTIFGAAVGYLEREFGVLGLPFEDRGPRTDEYIRAMKALWTQDNPSFEGKYVRFSDVTFWPRPVQKPHPPIWIGGRVKATVRRAAELGDGWIPFQMDMRGLKEGVRYLNRMWDERGQKNPNFQIGWTMNRISIRDKPINGERQPFQGSPEQIVQDMEEFAGAGITFWTATFEGYQYAEFQENLERFAREIMPKFKARQPGPPY